MFDLICSVGSSVLSGISSTISSIGSAFSGFCSGALSVIVPMVEKGLSTFSDIACIAGRVLTALGVFSPTETVEDIGNRAIQGEQQGIKPENYDSFQSYIEALRRVELNPEKSLLIRPEDKISAGLVIGGKLLEEKLNMAEGSMDHLWSLAAVSPVYFTADRLTHLLQGCADVGSILDYFNRRLDVNDTLKVETVLLDADRKLSPDLPDSVRYQTLDATRDTVYTTLR